jgi:hypothetical protein
VESLEGRALLSAGGAGLARAARAVAVPAAFRIPTGPATPSEVSQVIKALRSGAGAEFLTLLRRDVKNYRTVIAGFSLGLIREYSVPGIVLKTPRFQDLYTGTRWDQLSVTAAGAVLAGRNRLVLGAILRGPIDEPTTSTYVFGIDRNGNLPPGPFAGRPNIRHDATVTVNVDAGGGVAGFVTDLNTGATTALSRRAIQIRGATLRVTVNPKLLPSTGAAVSRYRFAFWARSAPGGIENVASFAPEESSIPIGVLGRR